MCKDVMTLYLKAIQLGIQSHFKTKDLDPVAVLGTTGPGAKII